MDTMQATPASLVSRIRSGDAQAEAELYNIFSTGVRYLMIRKLGNASVVEDELHSAFIITIEAIRSGVLRDPERLMGFIRTVVLRRVSDYIEQQVFRRNRTVDTKECLLRDRQLRPDQLLMEQQQRDIAFSVLKGMSESDREVLVRFYLEEQTPERICREMNLTATQYRLLKHRAKAKFAAKGIRRTMFRPFWNHRASATPATVCHT